MAVALLTSVLASLAGRGPAADGASAAAEAGATPAPAPAAIATRCALERPGYLAAHSPAEVAASLVATLTLDEEVGLVGLWSGWHGYENTNAGAACIPRLTLSDGSDGVSYGPGGMTQLPAAIGLGATFSVPLAEQYGSFLGTEAADDGLDVLQGPDLNLVRVPDSGRSFETLGEDPVLAGDLGTAEVEGIEAEHVVAEPKHLGVYTQETDRPYLDQVVSQRTLEEVYLAPFEQAIRQGRALALMCAYGEIDGTPSCADPALYASLGSWGFSGLVRSDQDALDPGETLDAYESGLDLLKPDQSMLLEQAVQDGALPRTVLDAAVERVLAVMDEAGLLGRARDRDRRALARAKLARQVLGLTEDSMVLLKNTASVLPLRRSSGPIAIIGADAGAAAVTSGLGSAYVASHPSRPAAALAAAFPGQTRYLAASPRRPGDDGVLALPSRAGHPVAGPTGRLATAGSLDGEHSPGRTGLERGGRDVHRARVGHLRRRPHL